MTAEKKLNVADPPSTESPVITEMRATIERLEAQVARLTEPFAEKYEVLKNAVTDSGVPRQTLMRWVSAIPPLVRHYRDANGTLQIDVIDAKRQRFALAPSTGANGP